MTRLECGCLEDDDGERYYSLRCTEHAPSRDRVTGRYDADELGLDPEDDDA